MKLSRYREGGMGRYSMNNILNIKPLHDDRRDCFDDTIASVALWWGRDYALMLWKSWNFGFINENYSSSLSIGECIESKEKKDFTVLENYHGIKFSCYTIKSNLNILAFIQEELNCSRPIYVGIDSYWCPWDKNYQTLHNKDHCCLVVGMDIKQLCFYCTDPFYMRQCECLSFEKFFQGVIHIATFSLVNPIIKLKDWRCFIKRGMEQIKVSNILSQIEVFENYLQRHLDIKNEIKDQNNVWHSAIVFRIGRVILGRTRYILFLDYIRMTYNVKELEPIMGQLEKLAEQWSRIRALIVKGMLSCNLNNMRSRIALMIQEIARQENAVVDSLQLICS